MNNVLEIISIGKTKSNYERHINSVAIKRTFRQPKVTFEQPKVTLTTQSLLNNPKSQ